MNYIDLTSGDLALAALLLVNGLISLGFGLRLEASLAAAAVRMVVQRGVLGFLLKLVFAQPGAESPEIARFCRENGIDYVEECVLVQGSARAVKPA